jgi:hypothetical protein
MAREYLDFELTIGARKADTTYPVSARSEVGEAEGILRMPAGAATVASAPGLDSRHAVAIHGAVTSGNVLVPADREEALALGRLLFDALVSGKIAGRYEALDERARLEKKGIRVRLSVLAPELVVVPWELVYDDRKRRHVALSTETPLTRYLPMPQPISRLDAELPLRILAMGVSPSGYGRLDLGREREHLDQAFREPRSRGLIRDTWVEGTSVDALRQHVSRGPWHVFHFAGHGGFDVDRQEGYLVFGADGAAKIYASDLELLLQDESSIRLVVLNCCDGALGSRRDALSSLAATLTRAGIPAVIAMQQAIPDEAAIDFARVFYDGIARGSAVDEALGEARKAMAIGRTGVAWSLPVLYLRSPDGALFKFRKSGAPVTPRAAAPEVAPVSWSKLPPSSREAVERLLGYLGKGDIARLSIEVQRPIPAGAAPLLRAVRAFCEAVITLKLDVTSDNRAEIPRRLESTLQRLEGPYALYTPVLRPAVLHLVSLLEKAARSPAVVADIRAAATRFARARDDSALLRSLDKVA